MVGPAGTVIAVATPPEPEQATPDTGCQECQTCQQAGLRLTVGKNIGKKRPAYQGNNQILQHKGHDQRTAQQ
jgi:hypothetical protein